MATHIILASEPHIEGLRRRAASKAATLSGWTVPSTARTGDPVIFYVGRPLSSFVATAVIAKPPWVLDDPSNAWHDRHHAQLRQLAMLPRFVPLAEVRRVLPDWPYLRLMRSLTTVPTPLVRTLQRVLGQAGSVTPTSAPEFSAIEGVMTEMRAYRRSRSRALRDRALALALGVCAVCETDFRAVLGGRGVRVLQVHHRRQLAQSDRPRLSKVTELAVVCSNCHLLIHSDPQKALALERLRRLLKAESKGA